MGMRDEKKKGRRIAKQKEEIAIEWSRCPKKNEKLSKWRGKKKSKDLKLDQLKRMEKNF